MTKNKRAVKLPRKFHDGEFGDDMAALKEMVSS